MEFALIMLCLLYGGLSVVGLFAGYIDREYIVHIKIGHIILPTYLIGYYFGILCDTELKDVKAWLKAVRNATK